MTYTERAVAVTLVLVTLYLVGEVIRSLAMGTLAGP